MLWTWTGLIWLWIKNKGRKNFTLIKKENPDYEQIGVDILWNIWLSLLIILFIFAVIYGLTVLFRFINEAKHFLE